MHKSLTAALVITLCAGAAVAQQGAVRSDLSPEDLAGVRRVTAPTADFSAPENFEAMQAGAGLTGFAGSMAGAKQLAFKFDNHLRALAG
jgi:hypothetical protein